VVGAAIYRFLDSKPPERIGVKSVEYPLYLDYSERAKRKPQAKDANFNGNSGGPGVLPDADSSRP
jgi:hypothetical protein